MKLKTTITINERYFPLFVQVQDIQEIQDKNESTIEQMKIASNWMEATGSKVYNPLIFDYGWQIEWKAFKS